jgi:RimJ/RimL family protein N-acetyltransferase
MKVSEFTKFGITFKPLSEVNLEMVRIWRNSDDVRLFMQYQEIITPEQQKVWFKKINNVNNYYFVVYDGNEPFGLFNIKDIDYISKIGETGSFLRNRSYWGSDLAGRASLGLGYFAFEIIKLDSLFCHILKSNNPVIKFNKHQGFIIDEEFSNDYVVKMICSKFDFNRKTSKFMKYFS